MPDVKVTIEENGDDRAMQNQTLKEWIVPRDFWDDWTTRNPTHELADQIGSAVNEFDGLKLDVTIEFRPVAEEQMPRPRTPRFTGRFDADDYEAFYLEVTSQLGIDESISCEEAAGFVRKRLA